MIAVEGGGIEKVVAGIGKNIDHIGTGLGHGLEHSVSLLADCYLL